MAPMAPMDNGKSPKDAIVSVVCSLYNGKW